MDIGIVIENPSNTKGPDVQANYLVSYLHDEYGARHNFTVICKEGSTLHNSSMGVEIADILVSNRPIASVRRLHKYREEFDLLHIYAGSSRLVAAALFRADLPVLIGPSTEFASNLHKMLLKVYNPPVVLASYLPWKLVQETHGHPDNHLFFVPNGFPVDEFAPLSDVNEKRAIIENRHGIELRNNVIIWVNHLTAHKRPLQAIQAFRRLNSIRSDTSFIMIGDGEQRQDCQELLSSVDNAHYLGYIHHDNIPQYFQIADVSLITSKSEGFSNVIYESMACGLPVVTSTTFDQIGSGEYGRYLPVDASAEEIAEGLDYTIERKEELGQLARQHVVETHGIPTFGDKYMQLYQWLMDKQDKPTFSTEWVSETVHRVQRVTNSFYITSELAVQPT